MFDKDIITAHNSYKLFLHNTFSGQKIFKTNEEIHPGEWLNIAKSATDSGKECLNSNNIFESFVLSTVEEKASAKLYSVGVLTHNQ